MHSEQRWGSVLFAPGANDQHRCGLLARSSLWFQGHDSSRKVPGFIVLFHQRHRLRQKMAHRPRLIRLADCIPAICGDRRIEPCSPVPASPGRPWELTGNVNQPGTYETLGHEAVDRKQTPCSTRRFLAVLKRENGRSHGKCFSIWGRGRWISVALMTCAQDGHSSSIRLISCQRRPYFRR